MPIEWGEPPEIKYPDPPAPEWAKELAANPGQWGMVERLPKKSAANHRQNRIAANNYPWQSFYDGYWEATYRAAGDKYLLYVRYMI